MFRNKVDVLDPHKPRRFAAVAPASRDWRAAEALEKQTTELVSRRALQLRTFLAII